MRAITVCVQYSDLLAITLPANIHHFDEFWIVTSLQDVDTLNLYRRFREQGLPVYLVRTDRFYEGGAAFAKWKALELGLEIMERHGWTCIAPWVPVQASGIKAASRKYYRGDLLNIKTAGGKSISVTPDHKVLTEHGWRCAKTLRKGDNLFRVLNVDPIGAPYVNKHPSPIGQVVDSLFERATSAVEVPENEMRAVRRRMDLKRNFSNSQVDVVRTDGHLATDLKPFCQTISKLMLETSDTSLTGLFTGSHLSSDFRFFRNASKFLPSSFDPFALGFRTVSSRPNNSRLAMAANSDSGQSELTSNCLVIDPQRVSNKPLALPGLIAPDNIVFIQVISWSDHVYDLSTDCRWFTADDIIIHNCVMDADILWPKKIPHWRLDVGCLYTPLRRMFCDLRLPVPPEEHWSKWPLHPQQREWAGYTQVFHADDPNLGKSPWYETTWKHAGGADSFFQMRWRTQQKLRPPFEVLHLGTSGENWCGRVSPYLDGHSDPKAQERRQQLHGLLAQRRQQRNTVDPYRHERTH